MDDFDSLFEPVDVRVCRPRLCWSLLGGGRADYFDGTNTRVLDAGQWLQPFIHTITMSGFFGVIQPLLRIMTPHYILLRFFAGQKDYRAMYSVYPIEPEMFQVRLQGQKHGLDDQPIWEHLYKRSFVFVGGLSPAIEQFLQGAPPTAQVRLWRA